MPGMNGRELADRLMAEYRGLEVLFTSGYPEDMIIRNGVADGTVESDELARKVRTLLDC